MTDGVKVELELSPEGATENPFAAISINHLRIKEAGKQAEYAVAPKGNAADYKDNLQFNIKEHFEFPGIIAAANLLPKVDLVVQAKLDLVNEGSANTTQLRAYLATQNILRQDNYDFMTNTHNYVYTDEDPKNAIDLTYSQGRLSLLIDKSVSLIGGMGADMTVIYGFLASPIGNLIENVLQSADPAQAAAFSDLYWTKTTDTEGNESKSWNKNFKALVVDNVTVSDLLGLMMPAATTSEDPAPAEPEQPASPAGIMGAITKIFGMINAGSDKLTISTKGLLSTICDLATAFGTPLTPTSALQAVYNFVVNSDFSILESALSFEGGGGQNMVQRLQWLLDRDANFANDPYTEEEDLFNWDFYFTENGINWDLSWYSALDEPNETTGQRLTVGIVYNSEISFTAPTTIEPFDLTEYNTVKKAYDDGIAAAKQEVEAKQQALDAANADLEAKTTAYQATNEYKKTVETAATYKEAKDQTTSASTTNIVAQLKQADGTPYGSYYTATLGKAIGYDATYGLWRQGATVANNANYRGWSSPLLAWVQAGKLETGAERDALNTKIEAIKKLIDDNTNLPSEAKTRYKAAIEVGGELFNALLAECEAVIADEAAQAANKLTDEYQAYTTATSTQKSKASELTAAQAAYDALEDPYFAYFYWDLKAEA